MSFAIIDGVFLAVILILGFRGLKRGLVREIFGTLGILLSLILAAVFHEVAAAQLNNLFGEQVWTIPAAFLIILILAEVLFLWLEKILAGIIRAVSLIQADRVFGFLLGAVEGIAVCYAVTYLLGSQDFFNTAPLVEGSALTPLFLKGMPFMVENLQQGFTRLFS